MNYPILILAAFSLNAGAYGDISPTINSPQERLSNQTQQFNELVDIVGQHHFPKNQAR